MVIKIAVVQLEARQYERNYNLNKIISYVKEASHKGANVIIFPEDCIDGIIRRKKELADSTYQLRNFFIDIAKKYNIDIITGSFIERENDKLWNTSYYIESTGKIKARYKKINLWHPERCYISKGKDLKIFKTKYGKAAIIICWDLAFPDLFKKMLKENVKLIYCPSYWLYEDAEIGMKYNKNADKLLTNNLCMTRAFEANACLVYCNAAGNLELGKFKGKLIGNSQIALPFKGSIKILEHNKEEMFIQEINLDILKDSEKNYKLRKDLLNNYD